MIKTGKVIHKQIVLGDKAFEATCLAMDNNQGTCILRYASREPTEPALNHERLSRWLGKRVWLKASGMWFIPGYPYPMLALSPDAPIGIFECPACSQDNLEWVRHPDLDWVRVLECKDCFWTGGCEQLNN